MRARVLLPPAGPRSPLVARAGAAAAAPSRPRAAGRRCGSAPLDGARRSTRPFDAAAAPVRRRPPRRRPRRRRRRARCSPPATGWSSSPGWSPAGRWSASTTPTACGRRTSRSTRRSAPAPGWRRGSPIGTLVGRARRLPGRRRACTGALRRGRDLPGPAGAAAAAAGPAAAAGLIRPGVSGRTRSGRSSMTRAIAGSIIRWPQAMTACSPIAPAQYGTSRATNGHVHRGRHLGDAPPRVAAEPHPGAHADRHVGRHHEHPDVRADGHRRQDEVLDAAEREHPDQHRGDHLEVVPDEVPHRAAPVRGGVSVGGGNGLGRHAADRRWPRRRCQVPEVTTAGHDRGVTPASDQVRAPGRGAPPGCGPGRPSFASTLVTWFLTVPSARNNAPAISRLLRPRPAAGGPRARARTAGRRGAAGAAAASSGSCGEAGDHPGGDRRLQHRLPAGGGEQRLDQAVAGDVLQQVADGARPQRREHVLVVVEGGEGQHPDVRAARRGAGGWPRCRPAPACAGPSGRRPAAASATCAAPRRRPPASPTTSISGAHLSNVVSASRKRAWSSTSSTRTGDLPASSGHRHPHRRPVAGIRQQVDGAAEPGRPLAHPEEPKPALSMAPAVPRPSSPTSSHTVPSSP